jgi:uncharacterized protein
MTRRDSTEAELDALQAVCERLGGFDERVNAEWLDGAFAALLAGPSVPAGPAEVMPVLLPDAWERTFGDPDDVAAALAPLDARWRVLRSQIDPELIYEDPDRLQLAALLLSPDEPQSVPDIGPGPGADADADADGGAGTVAEGQPGQDALQALEDAFESPRLGEVWAEGFLTVTEDPAWGWTAAADPEAIDAMLGPVRALMLDAEELAAWTAEHYRGEPPTRDQLVDDAAYATQDLRLYWLENAPRTAPRRVEATPGRNDPCPCGSGKKFKKCHGAN